MEQIGNKWKAQDGYFFVRVSDNMVMGDLLFLAEDDSISNYIERPFTEQEREAFEAKYSFGGDSIPVSSSDTEEEL